MNIKAISNKIGINYENTLESFCGDVSALSAKLEEFASSYINEKLKAALNSGNIEELKKLAHETRKAAEKIGLDVIARASRRVEDADIDKAKNASLVLIEKIEEITNIIKNQE